VPGTLSDIEYAIGDIARNAPDTRVHIIADRAVPFESVNSVIEIMQILQYRVVSFVVKDNE
jgi:biopolymer transport protein ExbD